VIFHMLFYDTLEYHRDELLYLALGEHPAFGYASVPPMVGWVAFLLNNLTGYSLFVVKLTSATIGGAVVYLTGRIAQELGGNTYSSLIGMIGVITASVLLRVFHLFQPVPFDVFFWTLTFYFYLRWLNTNNLKYLTWLGISIGLGFLTKYLILILAVLIFTALLIAQRTKIKEVFLRVPLLSVLIAAPNIIWQVVNGFPVIEHMTALRETQLVNIEYSSFLTDQLVMSSNAVIILVAGLLYLLFSKRMSEYRSLGFISIMVVIILLLLKGKSYYTIGVFPVTLAAGGVFFEYLIKNRVLKVIFPVFILVLSWGSLPLGIPIYGPEKLAAFMKEFTAQYELDDFLRDEDGNYNDLPQDYADMIGWNELAEVTAAAYHSLENPEDCIIYGENYGQAGAITVNRHRLDLPEPICFSGSYFYWFPRSLPSNVNTLIYINDELGDDVRQVFGSAREVGRITNPLAREYGTKVFLCTNPRGSLPAFWEQVVPTVTTPFR